MLTPYKRIYRENDEWKNTSSYFMFSSKKFNLPDNYNVEKLNTRGKSIGVFNIHHSFLSPASLPEIAPAITDTIQNAEMLGLSEKEFAKKVLKDKKPIEATLFKDKDGLVITDGHHRFIAAKILDTFVPVSISVINVYNTKEELIDFFKKLK